MTFGVSRDHGAFEWSGTSLASIFAQRSNLFSPRFWLMIFDIIRFNQFALDLLRDAPESDNDPSRFDGRDSPQPSIQAHESIGSYLEQNGYSEGFRNDYLIPMTAAVWSTSPDKAALDFPAITLIRFLWNHHLLSTVTARPPWKTIKEGSRLYIDAILKDFPKERIHLSNGVKSAETSGNVVKLTLQDGSTETFDHLVLATHGDTAADIIWGCATQEERQIMSNFHTSSNVAVLHSDRSVSVSCYHVRDRS